MNKILFCLLGLPLGFMAGIICGTQAAVAAYGGGDPRHAAELGGAFIGAPVGIVIGGVIGIWLGAFVDRKRGGNLTRVRMERILIGTAIGTALGLTMFSWARSPVPILVGAWLGVLGGCLWCILAKKESPKR
jgi:predicted MFS family arabinose efflux permease